MQRMTPYDLVRDPLTWRALPYLLVSFWMGLAWAILLFLGITFSLMLVVFWVGIPLSLLTVLIWRWGAMLERRLLRLAFDVQIPDPYTPLEGGPIERSKTLLKDRATWKDLGYLVVLTPVGFVEFMVLVFLGGSAVSMIASPLIVLLDPYGIQIMWAHVDTLAEAMPWAVVGAGAGVACLYAVRGMAFVHSRLAVQLLGPSWRERAEHLQASRARAVDAAEAERRRIERDLHDGAQQRLLGVAMELGRAQARADLTDETRTIIETAHAEAKTAIQELRNLARGIYPAILTDRGLDAALSALAARAPLKVTVEVDLEPGGGALEEAGGNGTRPPAAVESIAYFIVSETLANCAKHARATQAGVRVSRGFEGRVIVEVWDNGVGGARAEPGGGLAGLADRAATIDGILVINSPPGGPTVIRAELPSAW